jgi:hypothetical protein
MAHHVERAQRLRQRCGGQLPDHSATSGRGHHLFRRPPAIPVTDRDTIFIGKFMHTANALFTPLTDPGDMRSGAAAGHEAKMGFGLKDAPLGCRDAPGEFGVAGCGGQYFVDHRA